MTEYYGLRVLKQPKHAVLVLESRRLRSKWFPLRMVRRSLFQASGGLPAVFGIPLACESLPLSSQCISSCACLCPFFPFLPEHQSC